MALIIRTIKTVYKQKIQKGKRIQIPLTIWNPSGLYEGLTYEMVVVAKGDVIEEPGIFIKFLDENQDELIDNVKLLRESHWELNQCPECFKDLGKFSRWHPECIKQIRGK